MNWRDVRHPRAGGAEFHTHELARRLIASGCDVEWFTAAFPGAPRFELVDGVRVIRMGKQWSVHLHAIKHYQGSLHGKFDVVIDQVNTVPFFTPLWAQIPVVMMIWQLAREVWWYESPFPLSVIGYALEPLYLQLYRRTSVVTYSNSTKSDLIQLGFRGEIAVIPIGIEAVDKPDTPKSQETTFVYVGRLAKSKRIHEIIEAFALFRCRMSRGRLVLIGEGSSNYVRRLEELATSLKIRESVEFAGWLRGSAKHRRMAEAHALLMASAREGWGLVVTESNYCGTPAVVYDVPGLRDSVRHLETGLVVAPTPHHMCEGMVRLTVDLALYERLRRAAQQWSQTFTHDAGARIVNQKLEALVSA